MKYLAAVEAAGLKSDKDMLVPSLAAAGIIGVKQQTLALWRCERRHNLSYIKNGRRIHYRLGELRRFLVQQEQHIPAVCL
ncbi:MAG: DNA-binding protein [Steroidobacteraceae bacterium]